MQFVLDSGEIHEGGLGYHGCLHMYDILWYR